MSKTHKLLDKADNGILKCVINKHIIAKIYNKPNERASFNRVLSGSYTQKDWEYWMKTASEAK